MQHQAARLKGQRRCSDDGHREPTGAPPFKFELLFALCLLGIVLARCVLL